MDYEKFKQITKKPTLNGRKSVYFSIDKNIMRKPVCIGSGIYVESNMSANAIRN